MAIDNLHKQHRERVRKQFLEEGFSNATPKHKILEMLLFYSIPRKDTNEIGHALLNRFGSITAIMEATPNELMRVEGVGENTAALIKLLPVFCREFENHKVVKGFKPDTLDEIYDFLAKKYYGRAKETMGLTTFNNKGEFIAFDIMNVGDVESVYVSTRSVIEKVIERKAVCAVISHNHPNGNANPSPADIEMTTRIKLALSHINVKLLDHMIFDGEDGISMAQSAKYAHYF